MSGASEYNDEQMKKFSKLLTAIPKWSGDRIEGLESEVVRLTAELAAVKTERDGLLKECLDLKVCWADEEKAHVQTIESRDEAEGAFTDLAATLDVETEFSNLRGYGEIIEDCVTELAQHDARMKAEGRAEGVRGAAKRFGDRARSLPSEHPGRLAMHAAAVDLSYMADQLDRMADAEEAGYLKAVAIRKGDDETLKAQGRAEGLKEALSLASESERGDLIRLLIEGRIKAVSHA